MTTPVPPPPPKKKKKKKKSYLKNVTWKLVPDPFVLGKNNAQSLWEHKIFKANYF